MKTKPDYPMSWLQFVVLTIVVIVLVIKNDLLANDQIFTQLVGQNNSWDSVAYVKGWPWSYWYEAPARGAEFYAWSMMGDLVVGLILVYASCLLVAYLEASDRRQPRTNVPQPWHRITLLQILVAVTLVAMLLSKNTTKQEYASSIDVHGAEGTEDMITTAGWPFVYWHDRIRISSWEYTCSIVGNFVACGLVVSATLILIAAIEEDTYKTNGRRFIESWLALSALQKAGAITTLFVCGAFNLPNREFYPLLHGGYVVSTKAGFPIKFGETTMYVSSDKLTQAYPPIRILRWDALGSNLFLAACASMVTVRCVGSWTRYSQRRRMV